MKNFTYLLILVSFFASSCGSTMPHIFGKRTPHEKYEDELKDTGLSSTPEGRLWIAASEKAITAAQDVPVPFKVKGHFGSDKPRALGFSFKAKMGERIDIDLNLPEGTVLYADVFKSTGNGTEHVLAPEKGEMQFSFEAMETATYILRVQPEIASALTYELALQSSPSLEFPVAGSKARVGSVWGDSRDGGKRSHEGIDIFAPKRTDVVAIADGYITAVRNGGLGGKTVNLRPNGSNYSLYYAHLDEQLVSEGQFVKKGDVIGKVGNTGNAKTTPPHLHFGIYTRGGAVDPLPFVNRNSKKAPAVTAVNIAGQSLKLVKSHKTSAGVTISSNTLLTPLAITSKGYIAENAEGDVMTLPVKSVKLVVGSLNGTEKTQVHKK